MQIREGKEQEYEKWVEINNNSKEYIGKDYIEYTERWAEMMEYEINKSDKEPQQVIMENAERLRIEADKNDNCQSMHVQSYSVIGLYNFWEYGRELLKWHNGKFL